MKLFKTLHWNAGGLLKSKKAAVEKFLMNNDVDVFSVVEANITEETHKYYKFAGYKTYILPKHWQIASGILIGAKSRLTADFKIVKEMSNSNTSEIAKLEIWINNNKFMYYSIYSPANNKKLNLNDIKDCNNTIVTGDFNGYSPRWGYHNLNTAGIEIENFGDGKWYELLYNPNDLKPHIYYTGNSTTPDLVLVSSNLTNRYKKLVIEDVGSGHRMVETSIKLNLKPNKSIIGKKTIRTQWNFKKSKLGRIQQPTTSPPVKHHPKRESQHHYESFYKKYLPSCETVDPLNWTTL